MGAGAVYPFLNRASITKQEDRSAQQGAKNCWDALNTALFVTGISFDLFSITQTVNAISSAQLEVCADWRTTVVRGETRACGELGDICD